jgi:hypothetical protein
MSFGLSMYECGVSSIDTHAEALRFYESCKVKRGRAPTDPRPIRGKERSPMDVRVEQDNVIFRYHRTDVVTWRPDNSYVLSCWTSQSTATFASAFIPFRHHSTKESTVLQVGDKMYPVVNTITVRADNTVETQAVFAREVVNRANAKRALATTRYADYRAWHKLMWPMVCETATSRWAYTMDTSSAALADEANWHDIMMGIYGNPDTVRERLYHELRREFAIYDTVQEPWLLRGTNLSPWHTERKAHE